MNVDELREQQAVIEWCGYYSGRYPELKAIYHIPNEGKRSVVNGSQLKAAGLKSGVPDLCLPCPRGGYAALYIEMKKDEKAKVSPAQKEWLERLSNLGNYAVVCRSATAAISVIESYLKLPTPGGVKK